MIILKDHSRKSLLCLPRFRQGGYHRAVIWCRCLLPQLVLHRGRAKGPTPWDTNKQMFISPLSRKIEKLRRDPCWHYLTEFSLQNLKKICFLFPSAGWDYFFFQDFGSNFIPCVIPFSARRSTAEHLTGSG